MWHIIATTAHGKTLHYTSTSRTKARAKRAALDNTPFIRSTTAPVKGLSLEKSSRA